MDLQAIERRLVELEARYQAWVAPINRAFWEGLHRVNRDGYTSAQLDQDVQEVRERQHKKGKPFQEMHHFLDELCPAYLEASADERAGIRAAVKGKGGVQSALVGYAYRAGKRIESPADETWLRWGLAALSIEDCAKDYRDLFLALAELYVTAEGAGIKPGAAFRAVGRLSSTLKSTGGEVSMQELLIEFRRSGALRERRRIERSTRHRQERGRRSLGQPPVPDDLCL